MKFRAVMLDPQCMREFHNIIQTLSKLSKVCVMNISAERMCFIANEESGTTAPLVWVEINAKMYFTEYKMEGVRADNPHIMLSVSAANLSRALAGLRLGARFCKLKLTNIQFPCLTVISDVISERSEQSRQIVHDVPVNIIPRIEWPSYALPQIPACKLVLTMTSNRLMRALIEKLKNLSPSIIFYATSKGEMNLVAETSMATITTRYKNLQIRAQNPSDADSGKDVFDCSCSVDCKKISQFLSALQVPTLELSIGVCNERIIHMEVDVREGVVMHSLFSAVCI